MRKLNPVPSKVASLSNLLLIRVQDRSPNSAQATDAAGRQHLLQIPLHRAPALFFLLSGVTAWILGKMKKPRKENCHPLKNKGCPGLKSKTGHPEAQDEIWWG